MGIRKSKRAALVLAATSVVALVSSTGTSVGSAQSGSSTETWAQASGSLEADQSHPKLAPSLNGHDAGPRARTQRPNALDLEQPDPEGRIRVDVDGPDTPSVQAAIEDAGGAIYSAAPGTIRADVPGTALGPLSDDPRVERVHEPRLFRPDFTTQGVHQTAADTWQSNGRTGAGVKVAVVDLGFAGLGAEQTAGRLPATTNVSLCADGGPGTLDGNPSSSHGTAVAEIVHQMAPGAVLYLICFDQDADLSQIVTYLSAESVTIVNASWGNPLLGRGDGSGGLNTAAGAVAAGRSAGQLWAVAAGNDGGRHYSFQGIDADNDTAVEYFRSANPFPGPDSQEIFSFTLQPGQVADIGLKWDAWPVTNQEFALCFWVDVISSGTSLGCFVSGQSSGPPDIPANEGAFVGVAGHTNYKMAILRVNATISPRMDLYFFGEESNLAAVNAGSISDPASSPSAFAVGAYNWNSGSIEAYSSDGVTIDGRMKPDIAGPDAVSNDVFNPFRGTSAAAPHVAGAAALVKGAFPSMNAGQIQGFLTCRAMDGGAAGPDNKFGNGRLNMGALSATLPPNATKPALVRSTTIFKRNDQCSGAADSSLNYGSPGDQIIMCDWDGNGTKTPGAFRNGFWLLRNGSGNGVQDVPTFQLGDPGDIPVCGHWSNTTPGTAETAGVFRRGVFFLKFANTTGFANTSFAYGNVGDTPVTGDWNGDGITTVGVYRGGTWFLRNANGGGFSDVPPVGYGDANDQPVVGDWDGNGTTTMGVYRGGLWLLRNDNVGGFSTLPTFLFGSPGDKPRSWR